MTHSPTTLLLRAATALVARDALGGIDAVLRGSCP